MDKPNFAPISPINSIVFSVTECGDNLWKSVSDFLKLLTQSGYVGIISDINSGKGTILIEYVSLNPTLSNSLTAIFAFPDEIELIQKCRMEKMKDELAKKNLDQRLVN